MAKIRERGVDRGISAVIYIVLVLMAIATLYPFINIIAKAFSGFSANNHNSKLALILKTSLLLIYFKTSYIV